MHPKRRSLLSLLLLTCWLAAAGTLAVRDASAKDGGSNSGSGSSGSGASGSGSSGSNSGSSGSGSDNSGHGGGDDHGGGHGGDDGDDGDDDSGSGNQGHGSDYDRARDAVRDGKVLPLKAILKNIGMRRYGRVIDVRLQRSMVSDTYQLKVRDGAGTIRTLRINARNGTLLGGS
ncbi:hypothetical protein ASE04_02760 [Rhizobium sp. Root708]|uniref:PepSY domain-containing protein n=1 Tax=Rhizobium sp. Root708 TaxID=1736592 RepID=UPI0006FC560A|nr:hypothetical protein [Rhizobium sp. Root708]KRB58636.1 hypothetical protein ASE04_02760 [Rhizobium sp. Root708]